MTDPYRMIFVNIFGLVALTLFVIIYKFVYPKKNINLFFLLLAISILPVLSIFRSGTYQAGDLTLHSVFLQSFFENLKDGILIPKWAGGLCGGYGCPVFLFEYTMPFYIGSFFHLLGFSFLDSMKLFLASSFILSAITMYYFVKDELGEKSAFVASLLYIFAPIHLIEMHFRVSVGTVASFIFIPLVFLFAKKSLEGKKIYIILGAINLLFLLLSHSSISFVIIPASLVYVLIKKKKLKDLFHPLVSYVIGLGLSAYYVLPAISEIKYTWTGVTISSVSGFFPILYYIYSPSRFGFLFQGNNGELRLIVGYAQLAIILISIYVLFKGKYKKNEKILVIFLLLLFTICFMLMLSFTKPLWDNIIFLRSFVLPWRMLVPISFAIAFLGGIVTKNWSKTILIVFCFFVIGSTILNWGNRKMIPLDPNSYNAHWSLYTEYFEPNNPIYLARFNQRNAREDLLVLQRPSSSLQILSGKAEIKQLARTQNNHQYLVHADKNVNLSENTYYFPGWNIYINGKIITVDIKNPRKFGTLTFNLPKGLYFVEAKFENTPIRIIGDYISLSTVLIIIFIAGYPLTKKFISKV